MSKMEIQYRVLGAIGTNVYFLINKETKETLLVDPADNAPYLLEQIKMRGYDMKAILLTHGHFDHIYAVNSHRFGIGDGQICRLLFFHGLRK